MASIKVITKIVSWSQLYPQHKLAPNKGFKPSTKRNDHTGTRTIFYCLYIFETCRQRVIQLVAVNRTYTAIDIKINWIV